MTSLITFRDGWRYFWRFASFELPPACGFAAATAVCVLFANLSTLLIFEAYRFAFGG